MNPTTLEFLKALAGTINIQNVSEENKQLANENLNRILKLIQANLVQIGAESNGIIT